MIRVSNRWLYVLMCTWMLTGCHEKVSLYQEKEVSGIRFRGELVQADAAEGLDFTYRISATDSTYILEYGIQDQQSYLDRIYYFSYSAEQDFWLEYKDSRQDCIGVVFERNYKLTNDIALHVHFDYPGSLPDNGEILLVYHAKAFDYPPIKMKFKIKA